MLLQMFFEIIFLTKECEAKFPPYEICYSLCDVVWTTRVFYLLHYRSDY